MDPLRTTNRAAFPVTRDTAGPAREHMSQDGANLVLALAADSETELRRQLSSARSVLSRARNARECEVFCNAITQRRATDARYRATVLASTLAQLLVELEQASSDTCEHHEVPDQLPRLVFVCSGQGALWPGMAQTLLAGEPAFRAVIGECDATVRERYGWSLLQALGSDEPRPRLDATDVAQLSIASLQLGLGALWSSWGIVPDALMGHSLGEVTACGLAGILSRQDTLRVVGERACVLREAALERGGMVVVTLPEGRTSSGVLQLSQELDLAAYNSPSTLVLSGTTDAIRRMEPQLRAEGFKPERVGVTYASHCAQVDACLAPLRARLQGITPRAGTIPVRGTSREGWLIGPRCGPAFWAQNLRNPVRFRQAVEALNVDRPAVFVELSAHPLLLESIMQTSRANSTETVTVASCRRGEDYRQTMLGALTALYRAGFHVAWSNVLRTSSSLVRGYNDDFEE